MNETIEDIVREMRDGNFGCAKCGDSCDCPRTDEIIAKFADRIEAAHLHEVNHMIKVDNACVAQCAVLLDDHIKEIVADAKRRASNGND